MLLSFFAVTILKLCLYENETVSAECGSIEKYQSPKKLFSYLQEQNENDVEIVVVGRIEKERITAEISKNIKFTGILAENYISIGSVNIDMIEIQNIILNISGSFFLSKNTKFRKSQVITKEGFCQSFISLDSDLDTLGTLGMINTVDLFVIFEGKINSIPFITANKTLFMGIPSETEITHSFGQITFTNNNITNTIFLLTTIYMFYPSNKARLRYKNMAYIKHEESINFIGEDFDLDVSGELNDKILMCFVPISNISKITFHEINGAQLYTEIAQFHFQCDAYVKNLRCPNIYFDRPNIHLRVDTLITLVNYVKSNGMDSLVDISAVNSINELSSFEMIGDSFSVPNKYSKVNHVTIHSAKIKEKVVLSIPIDITINSIKASSKIPTLEIGFSGSSKFIAPIEFNVIHSLPDYFVALNESGTIKVYTKYLENSFVIGNGFKPFFRQISKDEISKYVNYSNTYLCLYGDGTSIDLDLTRFQSRISLLLNNFGQVTFSTRSVSLIRKISILESEIIIKEDCNFTEVLLFSSEIVSDNEITIKKLIFNGEHLKNHSIPAARELVLAIAYDTNIVVFEDYIYLGNSKIPTSNYQSIHFVIDGIKSSISISYHHYLTFEIKDSVIKYEDGIAPLFRSFGVHEKHNQFTLINTSFHVSRYSHTTDIDFKEVTDSTISSDFGLVFYSDVRFKNSNLLNNTVFKEKLHYEGSIPEDTELSIECLELKTRETNLKSNTKINRLVLNSGTYLISYSQLFFEEKRFPIDVHIDLPEISYLFIVNSEGIPPQFNVHLGNGSIEYYKKNFNENQTGIPIATSIISNHSFIRDWQINIYPKLLEEYFEVRPIAGTNNDTEVLGLFMLNSTREEYQYVEKNLTTWIVFVSSSFVLILFIAISTSVLFIRRRKKRICRANIPKNHC